MNPSVPLIGLELPGPDNPRLAWTGLHGAAVGLAVAEAFARHNGPVCVVARSAAVVEQLEHELEFFAGPDAARRFPDYETLPYEAISPPPDLLADRLDCLHRLASGRADTRVLVNSDALLNRLPPRDFIVARSFECRVGERIARDALTGRLVAHGYLRVDQATEPGEFAVRGALIDVYPSGAHKPVRIDLFDDEVESLRRFDPDTQISSERVDSVGILPAREFPFDADAIRGFRQRFRETFSVDPGRCPVYRDISEAILPAGIEYFLPLFFDATATLLDYLPDGTLVVVVEDALDGVADAWRLVDERHAQLEGDIERPILPPATGFVPPAEIEAQVAARPTLRLTTRSLDLDDMPARDAETAHALGREPRLDADRLNRWLAAHDERTLVTASSPGRKQMLLELLGNRGLHPAPVASWSEFVTGEAALGVAVGELETGLRLPGLGLRVVTGEQIGLERPRQRVRRRRPARDPESVIRELSDLRIGAPVVHEEYGVGRYRGLTTLDVDAQTTEFLLLEYADGDKLYVPVHDLGLVTRYTGASADEAPLHRLGSDQWMKARRKAAQQARDVAAELLNIYAQRAARQGKALASPADSYEQFALAFPFAETDDQLKAIDDVVADLGREQPMDRIVCGDVGFGKTEVAMRAGFVAVNAGLQVAMLVPTTLLAQQHYRSFKDRFADWPVEIELLSRFRSAAESKQVLERLESGRIDIVIGTHKLLQRDVRFKNLGVVIIDEEHRFGVKHKEQLKRLRAEVDTLTLTATPIPRTLNMTLGGLRDLSIIATPPAERLSVKTFVGEWSDRGVREAVLREIRRGGQVYVVHNRVENIEAVRDKLASLLPEAEIRVAHGQMSERALEDVMLDFYHRRFQVLLCTTIIESGIDIASANTIIINRADRLGLAQLYQLRGRVGRSHHQAYAYMIAPPMRVLTPDARKRLEAIASLEELGSGFALATHDLEIRGAGELLGEGQSGQIQAIGFTLYNELLGRAVRELREGREPALDDPFRHGPEVEIGLPALIPADYMPDVHIRLVHYKRIANAASRHQLDELQVELIDRFGLLPPPAKALFALSWLKLLAAELGVDKLRAGPAGGVIGFGDDARVDPAALVALVADEPDTYRLDGAYKLRITADWSDEQRRVAALEALLVRLGATDRASEAA